MEQIEYYKGAVSAGDCITNAWQLVKQNYGLYLGVSALSVIIITCVFCINLFLAGPVMCGVFYVYLKGIRGGVPEFGEMFKGFELFLPAMVVGLIQMLPNFAIQISSNATDFARIYIQGQTQNSDPVAFGLSGIVLLLAGIGMIVSLFVWITFFFSYPLVIDKKLGIGDAIKYSAKAGWSNVGGLILLGILQGLIAIGGFLVLCFGIFFVLPIIHASSAFAYRQVFPEVGGQEFQDTPPPPTEYAGNFGGM